MRRLTRLGTAAAVLAAAAVAGSAAVGSADPSGDHHQSGIRHVLLISVDGMHQSDLDWYIANDPSSELAKLVCGGAVLPGIGGAAVAGRRHLIGGCVETRHTRPS